jgi:hypothetical protein
VAISDHTVIRPFPNGASRSHPQEGTDQSIERFDAQCRELIKRPHITFIIPDKKRHEVLAAEQIQSKFYSARLCRRCSLVPICQRA